MFLKALKLTVVVGVLAISGACKHSHSHPHDQNQTDTTGAEAKKLTKEYGSAYVCPMHCKGSGSDQPGKCPVCKMDYVVNKDFKGGTDHHGHDHGDHEGHDHD